MSLSDENMDLMRPWTISEDDLFDEIVENGYVESSSAWRQFQPFFASCGYEICFHGLTDAKVPLVDLIKNSDNPFKPCADGPFVYHNPCGFDPSLGTYWKSWRIMAPKVTYAYDGYNRLVAIKVIPKTKPTKELEILMYLNSEPLRSSPENHTIPLLAEFPSEHADWIFFIMPAWRMIWENGIIVFQIDDYFNLVVQSLEGLSFLHRHGIAHGDVSRNNMVFNQDGSLYFGTPEVKPLITVWNCRLAYIDFDCAIRYDLSTDPKTWTTAQGKGTVPYISPEKKEAYMTGVEYQALPADVYALASVWHSTLEFEVETIAEYRSKSNEVIDKYRLNVYPREILEKYFPQFSEVLAKMMDADPQKRPTACEALQIFTEMRKSIPDHLRFRPKDGYAAELVPAEEKIGPNGFPWRPIPTE